MASNSTGYDMSTPEDTSDQIDTPTANPVRHSRSRKVRSFFNYHTVMVVLLVLINSILAFKGMALYNTVTQALATNKASAEQANIALNKAVAATQSQIMRSRLATESASRKKGTLLDYLSSKVITNSSSTSSTQAQDTANANNQTSVFPECPPLDFRAAGTRYRTDKVLGDHVFDRLYSPYMTPVRCESIKLLEIGLGCNMWYGAGHSLGLWLEFFPYAEIYFIENDQECAEKYSNIDERVKIFVGDQADREFLRNFIAETGGNFDFIIDDGGNQNFQQIISLEELVPALKPGGVYFLEDMMSAFIPGLGGHGDSDPNTTLSYTKAMISDLHSRRGNYAPNLKPLSNLITRVDCIDEMCAFTRKKEGQ